MILKKPLGLLHEPIWGLGHFNCKKNFRNLIRVARLTMFYNQFSGPDLRGNYSQVAADNTVA